MSGLLNAAIDGNLRVTIHNNAGETFDLAKMQTVPADGVEVLALLADPPTYSRTAKKTAAVLVIPDQGGIMIDNGARLVMNGEAWVVVSAVRMACNDGVWFRVEIER